MGMFDWLRRTKSATPVTTRGWTTINEPYMGAWQHNQEITRDDQVAFHAVFACIGLISRDMGKLPITVGAMRDGVRQVTPSPADKLLAQPNPYQNTQQFIEYWITSKLRRGNAYILKLRDVFGDLYRLYVLNPDLVEPLQDELGNVFYRIKTDRTVGAQNDFIVPGSEIIHDRFNCLFHPLVGLSPITACGLSAQQGVSIQRNSATFFGNMSRPSGLLTAPGPISQEKALEIQTRWNANYSAGNVGKTAVLGDGLNYSPMAITAVDAQMIEQLRMSGEVACSTFGVPPFKIGLGSLPTGQKVGDLNEIYYSDCLQSLIEAVENLLTQHLDLKRGQSVEFDLKSLIRMDSTSQMAFLRDGVGAGIIAPNEARAGIGLGPVAGGESPMIQQQNYSLAALARRDSQPDPFAPQNSAKPDQNTPKPDQNQPQTPAKQAFLGQYRGVFDAKKAYAVGDFVTKGGALWHCDNAQCGEFDHQNWTLAVKRGGANELGDA